LFKPAGQQGLNLPYLASADGVVACSIFHVLESDPGTIQRCNKKKSVGFGYNAQGFGFQPKNIGLFNVKGVFFAFLAHGL